MFVAGVLGACASSSRSSTDGGRTIGPICADCATNTAGGQTTDFGSGGGCQEDTRTPVDVDTARSLGFTVVDQLDRKFDTSLAWTPRDTTGQPATGYDAHTTLHVEMSLLGVDRVTTVDGKCGDYLQANVGVTLATADQAISVGGVLQSWGTELGVPAVGVEGTLDLGYAIGTLVLHPDPQPEPLAGKLAVEMLLWPQGARGQLSLSLVDASYQPTGGDVEPGPRYLYAPLDAKFPDDACDYQALPFGADDPGAAATGESASDLVANVAAMFGSDPLPGAWSDTGDVTVTTSFGAPTNVCVLNNAVDANVVTMQVPIHITSSDGRAHVDDLANFSVTYDAGTVQNEWLEATHDTPVTRDDFAAASGLSGIDFGDAPAASWHTELFLESSDQPETKPYGGIFVEAVDPNATPMGFPNYLATLHWWN